MRAWGRGRETAEYFLRTDLNFSRDCFDRYPTGPIFVGRPLPFLSFALALGLLSSDPLVMQRVSLRRIRERMSRAHTSGGGRSPMWAGAIRRAGEEGR